MSEKRLRPRSGAVLVELDTERRDQLEKIAGMMTAEYGVQVSMADVVRKLVKTEFGRRLKKSRK